MLFDGLHQSVCIAGGGRHADGQSAARDPVKPSAVGKVALVDWSQRQNVSSGLRIKIIEASSHSGTFFLLVLLVNAARQQSTVELNEYICMWSARKI